MYDMIAAMVVAYQLLGVDFNDFETIAGKTFKKKSRGEKLIKKNFKRLEVLYNTVSRRPMILADAIQREHLL